VIIELKSVEQVSQAYKQQLALATVHGMDYLLTWNCKHIANAEMQKSVSLMCHIQGYEPPVICTPEELMGD
jgi:hypothetical protein